MPLTHNNRNNRTSVDKYDPRLNLDSLFLRLENILRPLINFPDRVRIPDYNSISKQEGSKGKHWRKVVVPIIQTVSRETRVSASEIETILLQWWNPVELGTILQLATTMKKGREIVQREIRLRKTIMNAVAKLGHPLLPNPVSSELGKSCELALGTLTRELTCYKNAEAILLAAGSGILDSRNENRRKDKTKPRTGKTRTAVIALRRLFAHNVKSGKRQSGLIHQLLFAWNAHMAPPTSESIRTGYKSK